MFKKIFFTLLVFALFPMIIVTVLFYGYFSKSIHSEITTGAVNTLKNIDTVDERIVEERISDVLSWSKMSIPEVCLEYDRPEAMQVFLNRLKKTYHTYSYIIAYDSDGIFFASDQSERSKHQKSFRNKLKQPPKDYSINIENIDSGTYLVIISSIFSRINETIGYMSAYVKWSEIDSLFKEYRLNTIGSNFSAKDNKGLTELFYDKKFFPINKAAKKIQLDSSVIKEAIKTSYKPYVFNYHDTNYTMVCTKMSHINLQQLGIVHCLLIDKDAALAPLTFVSNKALIVAFVSLGIITLSSLVIAKQLLKPFKEVVNVLSRYRHKKNDCQNEELLVVADDLERVKETIINLIEKLMESEEKVRSTAKLAAIGKITSMLAHDVRKPFSNLKSVLDMFDVFNKNPSTLNKAKQDIERSIIHVESMIHDIMDFSRDVKINTTARQIVPIVDFSIRQVAQDNKYVNIHFQYNLLHDKQPLMDDERIARVFTNIIENSVEAILHIGKKRSGVIDISTSNSDEDGKKNVKIVIGNDGPLFNKEDIPKLFESFFTKGKNNGTGIGLASAQKIVLLHGGTITARNKPAGNGVEFIISLPASDKTDIVDIMNLPKDLEETIFSDTRMNESNTEGIAKALTKLDKHYKIVLLEDEALYRASVRNTIKRHAALDHRITLYEAHNVREAIALLQKENITHAIIDIDLGEMQNGFDFLIEKKVYAPDLKCIVHSNRYIEEDKQKSADLGALAFVPKPLNIKHLVEFLSM